MNILYTGVDEDGCVILLYSGNRKASLVYSGKTASGNNTATIMGSKGQIFVSFYDNCVLLCIAPDNSFHSFNKHFIVKICEIFMFYDVSCLYIYLEFYVYRL